MNKIVAITLSISLLMFPPTAIAQSATTPVTRVQPTQVDKHKLIAVAASATQNKDYQLALRVADNVIEFFPQYGTGYLYKAIALYKLEKPEAAKLVFDTAKNLYSYQLKSGNITSQEEKEARLGLETAELHLKLLETIGR